MIENLFNNQRFQFINSNNRNKNFLSLELTVILLKRPPFMSKKIQQCPSCINLHKKLKVLQADYDFEIKKLNEDRSTEKALYELSTNREIKKLQQKCQKQKEERVKQNESWMMKYDELIEKQKQQMSHFKLKKEKELQEFKKVKYEQLEKFKKETVAKLQKTIESLKKQKESLQIQLTQKYEKNIQAMSQLHQDAVKKLNQRHEEDLKKKSSQYEAVIVGIQSQKTVEQNLHKRTKEEYKDTQSKLHQQIYCLKKDIIGHEEKIAYLKSQIQEKCHKIEELHAQILKKQNQHSEKYQQLLRDYDQKYEAHKQKMESKIQSLFKKELQNCSKYEKALEKIQEHREIENQMYKANLNEIKSCVEQRPSRVEDVEEIIRLRQKLNKKQMQCQSLSDQLKWFRLELENKQQTYNRIFGPDSKNNESVFVRRKDMRMKRGGKSVTSVREALTSVNNNPNNLAPLIGNLQKKFLPPKQNKIL